jgi:hypothetical protein
MANGHKDLKVANQGVNIAFGHFLWHLANKIKQ